MNASEGVDSTDDAGSSDPMPDARFFTEVELDDDVVTAAESTDLSLPPFEHPNASTEQPEEEESGTSEVLYLRVVSTKCRTGLEPSPELEPEPGEMLAGRYSVEGLLGEAAFSKGYQANDTLKDQRVCIKIVGNTKEWMEQGLDEIRLLRTCNTHDEEEHYGIVRLVDFLYTREHLCVVTELLGPSLHDVSEAATAPAVSTFGQFGQLADRTLDALSFLHSLRIIHCDIKPENVLVPRDPSLGLAHCKLIDLGGSCFTHDKLGCYVQSRPYRAPEVLQQLHYGTGIDVWSLACVLFEAVTREVLFESSNNSQLLARMHSLLGNEDAFVPELVGGKRGLQLHSKRLYPWYMKYKKGKGSSSSESSSYCSDDNHDDNGDNRSDNDQPVPPVHNRAVELIPKATSLVELLRDCGCDFAGEVSEILSMMLVVCPSERPTADTVLRHVRAKREGV